MEGLMAHKDTKLVPEVAVLNVPEPQWTDTWHPISHKKVIHATEEAAGFAGVGVRDRLYSLSKDGGKMFAFWELDIDVDGKALSLVFRNSTDKSVILGFGAGSKTFICDNLAMSGEYLKFAKHTKGLDEDKMEEMVIGIFWKLIKKMRAFYQWQMDLHNYIIDEDDVRGLTFDLMENGAIAPSQFRQFRDCLHEERQLAGDRLYAVHGATTRLMRGSNLFQMGKRNKALNEVMDDFSANRERQRLIRRRF